MTRARLAALLVLVPAGVLATHGLAYELVADAHRPGLHDYLAPVAALAGPLVLVGWLWLISGGRSGPRLPSPWLLAAVQIVAFVGMETAERVAAGSGVASLVHERVVLVGLLLQGVVAVVLLALTRLGRAVVAAADAQPRARTTRGRWVHVDQWVPPSLTGSRPPARSPPLLLGSR